MSNIEVASKKDIEWLCNHLEVDLLDTYELIDLIKYQKKYSLPTSPQATDLCILTSGQRNPSKYYLKDITPVVDRNMYWAEGSHITCTDVVRKKTSIVGTNYNRNSRMDFSIRPTISFKNCKDLWEKYILPNVDTESPLFTRFSVRIKFGWYLRYASAIQDALDNRFENNGLIKTGKVFTIDKTDTRYLTSPFKPLELPVYEFAGTRFARMKIEQLHDRRSLFDILDADEKPYLELHDQINKYRRGEYVWLEVSEIPWIVDTEKMMLISEELLLSGIQYDTFDKKFPSLKYEKSNIKWYFNTYFKPEMLQFININLKDYGIETGEKEDTVHKSVTRVVTLDSIEKEKDNQENEKKKEIVKLLEEIRDNKKYYLGDDDINEIVKKKYNDYSRTISELKHKVGNDNNGLHLNTNDPNFYYQRLLLDLNEIIEKLRVHSTKVKDCHEMIDILNECLKSSIDVNKDGICKLVKEANDIILGTNIDRTTKNELIRKLDDIINNNIKRINSYIDEYKKDINTKTKTINELKEEFENDFQPFRKQIEKVKSCCDMIDILNECQKEEIDISKDSICETVNKIKTVIFKFLENEIIIDDLRRELDEILNNNINRVNSYIKEVFENKEDAKEKELDELKEEFARDLRPYLLKLQELVTKKDVVNEILIETKQIIQNTYQESSVTIAKNYLDELNKIMSIIRAKGTKKDVKKVEESLVNDYNITNSYEDIIAKLGNNIKIAYRIQLDIEENKQEKKEIEDVEVDIDIDSILDERNTK